MTGAARPLALLGVLLAALAVAGCGRDSTAIVGGGRVPGGTLTIATMLPREGPRAAASQAISLGAKVAIAESGGRVGAWAIAYTAFDEPARPEPLAAVTQEALRDISLIGVISDLDDATAAVTVPLFNAAGILQVSPGVTTHALPGEARAMPSGRRTASTLMPSSDREAAALVAAARGGDVAVEAESGDAPAEALAASVQARLDRTVTTERARTVIYAGTDADTALGAIEGIARENPRARLLAPQALWGTDLARRLPARVRARLRFTTAVGGPMDPDFVAAYRAAYGTGPTSPWAQVGWEAANRILAALRTAGPRANVRRAVIDAYFAADPAAAARRRPYRVVPAA